jgi:hypothetical protein
VGRFGPSTNRVENFFSQLKRSIDGTHHHVSTTHLGRYLGEFDFRYSYRKESDAAKFDCLMGQGASADVQPRYRRKVLGLLGFLVVVQVVGVPRRHTRQDFLEGERVVAYRVVLGGWRGRLFRSRRHRSLLGLRVARSPLCARALVRKTDHRE